MQPYQYSASFPQGIMYLKINWQNLCLGRKHFPIVVNNRRDNLDSPPLSGGDIFWGGELFTWYSPSQSSPLIRLFFFPQNRNRVSLLIPWFASHSFVLRPECWQSWIIPAQYCSFAWSIFRLLKISASYWEIRKIRHEKHEFCYRYFMTDECWF